MLLRLRGTRGDSFHADGLADNLIDYVDRFSADVDVFEYFDFKKEIVALEKAELLREVVSSFAAIDLHPDRVSNSDMGDAFEYIIRKFNEAANETSGDHYTPRDAIKLLVDLLFAEEDAGLGEDGIVRTLYTPRLARAACSRSPRSTCSRRPPTRG